VTDAAFLGGASSEQMDSTDDQEKRGERLQRLHDQFVQLEQGHSSLTNFESQVRWANEAMNGFLLSELQGSRAGVLGAKMDYRALDTGQ
jgi:hypothetical protein